MVGRFAVSWGGVVITHPGIKFFLLHLFRADGVHLSAGGTGIFLADLQVGLHGLLLQMAEGALSQGYPPPPPVAGKARISGSSNA